MPNYRATQDRCATCRVSLRGVKWVDAALALDLHRRIEDANAVEREAEEADGEQEDEAVRRTP
jgi:hypothetical protein